MIWLSNHEIALICADHNLFCVGFFVISPIKSGSIMRMEEQECSRHFAVPIEDGLTWCLRDVDNPFKSFDRKVREVHVDASIPDHETQPHKVRLCLWMDGNFFVTDVVVDFRIELRTEILSKVRVVDLSYLEVFQRCIPFDIFVAQFIGHFRVLDACVPIKPNDLRKSVPRLPLFIYSILFEVSQDIGLTVVGNEISPQK